MTYTKPQQLTRSRINSGAESLRGARFRLRGLFFPILRRRGGFERMEKACRYGGYFIDRRQERSFVGLGGFAEPADLSHELQRSGANLVGIDRRIKVEQGLDISAHIECDLKASALRRGTRDILTYVED